MSTVFTIKVDFPPFSYGPLNEARSALVRAKQPSADYFVRTIVQRACATTITRRTAGDDSQGRIRKVNSM